MAISKIVAIGGGDIKNGTTYPIDKFIMSLADKKNPKALFVPTASEDAPLYWQAFNDMYGKKLKCRTDALFLINTNQTSKDIGDKILNADIIYVGGGNTYMMLKIWKEQNVDKYLKMAYQKGVVLAGLSAGAMCWFEYGLSDAPQFNDTESEELVKLKGLGLVKGINCPHAYDESFRCGPFEKLIMKEKKLAGVAIDDLAALAIVGNKTSVIRARANRHVYKITAGKNGCLRERL
ncbi:MAG: hypothetical protein A2504_02060 [Bdellovibrionales bacterium RIFOXYD12_FULL_39_22]|nr:MAG: hypothetical protein A2385_12085 [Bdellovibrionales bacterium RIFOXYB1_FULL_39_21]OFZ41382.1 MAG: hypothetical protein A2485_01255 [Bdellovibrionales bacterium RIFOXYC12_FULL_39_17]OFZ45337.1 MAG: hypothetical protein A2404_13270 [Bdellovibrionales bacterium RIFOXYC1_FULL_39_130]OFZ74533.1 MAG: hypothetical protein A2560_12375 [Bdellovibrionales bacterium RIFOXYD1_FULL_39_84]OFZ92542.1 MAG: hypothetical protein A2504_02060 [Bdellovibrionales bacterium RIFOXYD12_FULL_39_22]HLE09721.1 pe